MIETQSEHWSVALCFVGITYEDMTSYTRKMQLHLRLEFDMYRRTQAISILELETNFFVKQSVQIIR